MVVSIGPGGLQSFPDRPLMRGSPSRGGSGGSYSGYSKGGYYYLPSGEKIKASPEVAEAISKGARSISEIRKKLGKEGAPTSQQETPVSQEPQKPTLKQLLEKTLSSTSKRLVEKTRQSFASSQNKQANPRSAQVPDMSKEVERAMLQQAFQEARERSQIAKSIQHPDFTEKDKEYIAEFVHKYQTTPTPEMAREYIAIRRQQDFEELPLSEKLRQRPFEVPMHYIGKGVSYLGEKSQKTVELATSALGLGKYNVGIASTQGGFFYPMIRTSQHSNQLDYSRVNDLRSHERSQEKNLNATQPPNIPPASTNPFAIMSPNVIRTQNTQPFLNLGSVPKVSGKVARVGTEIGVQVVPSMLIPLVGQALGASYLASTGSRAYYRGKEVASEKGVEALPKELWTWAKANPIEAAGVALMLGYGGYKGYKYLTEPKYIQIPRGNIKSEAVDIIQPVKLGGLNVERGKFVLKTTIPEQRAYVTTRWRDWLGLEPPREVILSPRKVYVAGVPKGQWIITREGEILNEPQVWTRRVGSNRIKASVLSGGQEMITPTEFSKLSETEKYALQKLAESKAGLPVPREFVPQILGKDFVYSSGNLKVKDIFIMTRKGNQITLRQIPYGKTTSMYQAPSVSKHLTIKEGIEIWGSRTGLKDITKPFARASGNVPFVDSVSLILPSMDYADELSSSGRTILKTKSSVSPKSMNALKQIESNLAASVLKGKAEPVPIIQPKEIPSFKLPVIKTLSLTLPKERIRLTSQQLLSQKSKVAQEQKEQPILIQERKSSVKTLQKLIPVLKSFQSQNQVPSQRQGSAQVSHLLQRQKYQNLLKIPFLKNPKLPKSPITPISRFNLFFNPSTSGFLRDLSPLSKAYTVKIRQRGKVIDIGRNLPYGRALKLGVSKVKAGLAQTFGLEESGFTAMKDVPYSIPQQLFTTPKSKKTIISPFTFVERRGKTLTTRGEIMAIKKASKNQKIKWW